MHVKLKSRKNASNSEQVNRLVVPVNMLFCAHLPKKTEDERKKLLKELKFLEEAKRAKQASLKLAQTRLDARQYRPPPENSEDPVQAGLLEELSGLTDSIDALDEQIEKSR